MRSGKQAILLGQLHAIVKSLENVTVNVEYALGKISSDYDKEIKIIKDLDKDISRWHEAMKINRGFIREHPDK